MVCRIAPRQQKEEAPGPSSGETRHSWGDASRAGRPPPLPQQRPPTGVCGRGALAPLMASWLSGVQPLQRSGWWPVNATVGRGCVAGSRAPRDTQDVPGPCRSPPRTGRGPSWGPANPSPQSEQQGGVLGGPSCPVATWATPASLVPAAMGGPRHPTPSGFSPEGPRCIRWLEAPDGRPPSHPLLILDSRTLGGRCQPAHWEVMGRGLRLLPALRPPGARVSPRCSEASVLTHVPSGRARRAARVCGVDGVGSQARGGDSGSHTVAQ